MRYLLIVLLSGCATVQQSAEPFLYLQNGASVKCSAEQGCVMMRAEVFMQVVQAVQSCRKNDA